MRRIHLLAAATLSFLAAGAIVMLIFFWDDGYYDEGLEVGRHSELVRMLEAHNKELEESAK